MFTISLKNYKQQQEKKLNWLASYLWPTVEYISAMGLCGLQTCDRLSLPISPLTYPRSHYPPDSDSRAIKLFTSFLEMEWKATLFLGPPLLFALIWGAGGKNAFTTASSSRLFRKSMTGPSGRYWNSEMMFQWWRELPEAGAVEGLLYGRGTVRGQGERSLGEDPGTRQGQSRLRLIHLSVPEKGPQFQVLQSIGHLEQRWGLGGEWKQGWGPVHRGDPSHFNERIHPCLSLSISFFCRAPRLAGTQFPDQGLNPGHRCENSES